LRQGRADGVRQHGVRARERYHKSRRRRAGAPKAEPARQQRKQEMDQTEAAAGIDHSRKHGAARNLVGSLALILVDRLVVLGVCVAFAAERRRRYPLRVGRHCALAQRDAESVSV